MRRLLITVLLMTLAIGCQHRVAPREERFEFGEPHMGTIFRILLYAPDKTAANRAARAALDEVRRLNSLLSDYEPQSELNRFVNTPAGTKVRLSPELFHVLEQSQELARETGGAFDPTMGPVVRLWRQVRKDRELPRPDLLDRALSLTGWENLELDPDTLSATLKKEGMRIDLGGIAKGYAADRALEVLEKHGITRALVAASGDIVAGDAPPGEKGWRVRIDPLGGSFQQELLLRHRAVSTSGDLEQFVQVGDTRYSHIVDPRTGLGLTNRVAVSVIAPTATESDSYATAISVLGPEKGLVWIDKKQNAAALVLIPGTEGITRFHSSDWPAFD